MNEVLAGDELEQVKKVRPLIHCITNYVTVNDCANVILAIGGIPTMSHHIDEVKEISSKADALVINIGTLSEKSVEAMIIAGKAANKSNVPIIFDPVGAAASEARKNSALKILKEVNVSVIRGNMAEIKVLLGFESHAKGVDSTEEVSLNEIEDIAKKAASRLNAIAVITGKIDYVSDGEKIISIHNGVEMMTRVTGAGCMGTALIGTFLGVTKDRLLAAVLGITVMGVAGEKAYENLNEGQGSGSFRVKLIDAVNLMTIQELKERGRLHE